MLYFITKSLSVKTVWQDVVLLLEQEKAPGGYYQPGSGTAPRRPVWTWAGPHWPKAQAFEPSSSSGFRRDTRFRHKQAVLSGTEYLLACLGKCRCAEKCSLRTGGQSTELEHMVSLEGTGRMPDSFDGILTIFFFKRKKTKEKKSKEKSSGRLTLFCSMYLNYKSTGLSPGPSFNSSVPHWAVKSQLWKWTNHCILSQTQKGLEGSPLVLNL